LSSLDFSLIRCFLQLAKDSSGKTSGPLYLIGRLGLVRHLSFFHVVFSIDTWYVCFQGWRCTSDRMPLFTLSPYLHHQLSTNLVRSYAAVVLTSCAGLRFETMSDLDSAGFDATTSNLLSVPIYVWACILTIGVGLVADRIGKRTSILCPNL